MYTNLPTLQGYVFPVSNNVAAKLCNFSNFGNFFLKISFFISKSKISLQRKMSIAVSMRNAANKLCFIYSSLEINNNVAQKALL